MNGGFGLRAPGFLVCAAALFVVASACASIGCKGRTASDATIVAAIPAAPLTLDPRLASDAEGDKISSLICDGLVVHDEHLDVVPGLAEKIEKLSDVSYRFHLRPGLLFHDGNPLVADDVVYTFKSIVDGKIASPHKGSYEWIESIVAESPLVVRIDLKEPYGPFMSRLTRGIVSRAAAEKLGELFGRAPVCAGPYKLVRLAPDSSVELSANPDYYGDKPKTKGLAFRVVKDDNVRVLRLIKGDVDLVQNAIPPMLLDKLMESRALKMSAETGIVMAYIGMNLSDPALSIPKVREAIALAIDRNAVISHRWKGLAVKANSILSPDNWAYAEGLGQYEHDPKKAKELLDEAGYPDPDGEGPRNRFKLTFKTSTVRERVDIARMLAGQLKAVGIDVRVAPYEWATFFRDVRRGNFQIYTLSWVGISEPDTLYEVFHSAQLPPSGLNRGRYKNEEVDRLVTEGRFTVDEEKRREAYGRAQKILFDELPFIPLWYEKNVIVYREGLSNVKPRPDASYRAFMKIEKR